MTKKKELLSKVPWRGDDEDSDKFSNAKLKVTKESDGMSKMHVPSRGTKKGSLVDDDDPLEIDPQLRYSFNRNYQFLQRVFTIDTLVKPLPPAMAFNVSRNLSFFTRIFTQFFGDYEYPIAWILKALQMHRNPWGWGRKIKLAAFVDK